MLGCVDLRCGSLFPTYAAVRPAGDAAVRVKLCKVFRSRQCDTRYVPGTSACATRRPGSPSAGLPLAGAEGTGRPQPGHSAPAASGFLGRDGAPGQAAWAPPLRARLPPQSSPLWVERGLREGPSPGGTPSRSCGIHAGPCARDGPSPRSAADTGTRREASPTSLFDSFPHARCSPSLLGPRASYMPGVSSREGLRRRGSGPGAARGFWWLLRLLARPCWNVAPCVRSVCRRLCGGPAPRFRGVSGRRRPSGSGGRGDGGPTSPPRREVACRPPLAPSSPGQALGAHSACFPQGGFSLEAADGVGQATPAHHPRRRRLPGIIPASLLTAAASSANGPSPSAERQALSYTPGSRPRSASSPRAAEPHSAVLGGAQGAGGNQRGSLSASSGGEVKGREVKGRGIEEGSSAAAT